MTQRTCDPTTSDLLIETAARMTQLADKLAMEIERRQDLDDWNAAEMTDLARLLREMARQTRHIKNADSSQYNPRYDRPHDLPGHRAAERNLPVADAKAPVEPDEHRTL